MPRGAERLLWDIGGAREFHVKHVDNPAAHGRAPLPRWKEKERRGGYSFRFDAMKFWKQILIPGAAAADLADEDVLIWLDADVETVRPIGQIDILGLLGKAEVAFLSREPQHSEIGFWAVRLNARTRAFLADMAAIYTTGEVFGLPEWHSAFVWDVARRRAGLQERNLCRRGARGHVWPMSPLARWMRHDKGPRKPR